jgi:hypothetical protein
MSSQYSVTICTFADQGGMGWNSSSTSEGVSEDKEAAIQQAIMYFESDGNGPLAGLTRSPTWTLEMGWNFFPDDGDYGVDAVDDWAQGRPQE